LKVAVCILNFNGAHYLKTYLPFLLNTTYGNCLYYVIDNGSTDDSALIVAEYPNVIWKPLDTNYGYAGGYNIGLKNINADVLVLLNSDVEVSPNWLEPIIDLFNSNHNIAAIQPKILQINKRNYFEYAGAAGGYIDALGYSFCKGRIFDYCEADISQYNTPTPIMWASGACLCIKKDAYEKVGGLDALFFAHFEEIDLCWRLQRANYQIYTQPLAHVYHVGGGTLPTGSYRKVYLNFRNNLFMLIKNAPISTLLWLLPTRFMLDAAAAYKGLFGKEGFTYYKAVFMAHLAVIRYLFSKKNNVKLPRKNPNQGFYKGSIVYAYFVKKINTFNKLKISS
jgi:GT2 family glycosyltransferase